jgi:hypothetical protein
VAACATAAPGFDTAAAGSVYRIAPNGTSRVISRRG